MAGSGCLHHSRRPGEHLEELADQVIDLIGKAQEPDGYLNTYFSVNAPAKKWTNLVEGHELYTAGHMIEAAVAYYQATGKEKILNIAKKNADLICRVFGTGEGQKRGYPGHQEIELALVKLYRETEKEDYLQQAGISSRRGAEILIICRQKLREEDIRNFFRSSRGTIWNIHRLTSLL